MTVGGDRIEYAGELSTKTVDLTVTKTILNSVCSTKAALYMNMYIKNYYLGTPLERYEYVCIPISMIPNKIMDEYNLHALVHNGYLYVEVRKGMYGLPQAGLLANVFWQNGSPSMDTAQWHTHMASGRRSGAPSNFPSSKTVSESCALVEITPIT
jgi:hypothetical protein